MCIRDRCEPIYPGYGIQAVGEVFRHLSGGIRKYGSPWKEDVYKRQVIIFIVIVAAGLAIAVVTTLIGRIITNSITEPVEQIEAAVASLRKGEQTNVEMLTYETEDELGDTIRNLKEAMGILADYVSEISVEVRQ